MKTSSKLLQDQCPILKTIFRSRIEISCIVGKPRRRTWPTLLTGWTENLLHESEIYLCVLRTVVRNCVKVTAFWSRLIFNILFHSVILFFYLSHISEFLVCRVHFIRTREIFQCRQFSSSHKYFFITVFTYGTCSSTWWAVSLPNRLFSINIISSLLVKLIYEGGSTENLKSTIKIWTTARLSCKFQQRYSWFEEWPTGGGTILHKKMKSLCTFCVSINYELKHLYRCTVHFVESLD